MTPKFSLALALVGITAAGCSKSEQKAPATEPGAPAAEHTAVAPEAPGKAAQDKSAQTIAIDGSSTVFPISEAMAEEFQKKSNARVTVATSGTGGGFKKFCAKEIAIADASRPIKSTEAEACKAAGVEYVELPIAFDGIAVMVNPKNKWVDKLTVEELKKIWEPDAQNKVKTWADVRKGWPKEEIHLFGPGVDSGTYDYFTAAVVGQEHKSRGDFTSSEDDNVLVKGISTDKLALGFFGFAYYEENKDALKLVPIDDGVKDNGEAPVLPSRESIEKGSYQPLSRPIFIYVSRTELDRKEIQDFVSFYIGEGVKLISEVGYIPLPADAYKLVRKHFEQRKTGSVFAGGSKVGVTVTELLAKE